MPRIIRNKDGAVLVDEKIKERIENLIKAAQELSIGDKHGHALSTDHASSCKGWLAAAANVVQLVCGDSPSAYKDQFQKVLDARYGGRWGGDVKRWGHSLII